MASWLTQPSCWPYRICFCFTSCFYSVHPARSLPTAPIMDQLLPSGMLNPSDIFMPLPSLPSGLRSNNIFSEWPSLTTISKIVIQCDICPPYLIFLLTYYLTYLFIIYIYNIFVQNCYQASKSLPVRYLINIHWIHLFIHSEFTESKNKCILLKCW